MKNKLKLLFTPLLFLILFNTIAINQITNDLSYAATCNQRTGQCHTGGKGTVIQSHPPAPTTTTAPPPNNDECGGGTYNGVSYPQVYLSIDIGCEHKGNPIMDMTFAIIRILSDGVGLVIVASLIYAGIQYIGSAGDPQSTANAVNRIRRNVSALFIFIFGYTILNYLIPGQVLK